MTQSNQKPRISVTIDEQLLKEMDRLTNNRSAAVEEGLRLWIRKQIENQLRQSYLNQTASDIAFEQEWAQLAHKQMEKILDKEGL
jgi:metal-responsive CopG/Arc/MetJ family transcriptional regulator